MQWAFLKIVGLIHAMALVTAAGVAGADGSSGLLEENPAYSAHKSSLKLTSSDLANTSNWGNNDSGKSDDSSKEEESEEKEKTGGDDWDKEDKSGGNGADKEEETCVKCYPESLVPPKGRAARCVCNEPDHLAVMKGEPSQPICEKEQCPKPQNSMCDPCKQACDCSNK